MKTLQTEKKYVFLTLRRGVEDEVYLLEILFQRKKVFLYRIEKIEPVLKSLWKNLPSQERTETIKFFGLKKVVFKKDGQALFLLKCSEDFKNLLSFLLGEENSFSKASFLSISPEIIIGFC